MFLATSTITVAALNGFSSQAALTCSILPATANPAHVFVGPCRIQARSNMVFSIWRTRRESDFETSHEAVKWL